MVSKVRLMSPDDMISEAVCMCAIDSNAHFEVQGFQSTASIPPICDIPLTEVNCKLYKKLYQTDGLRTH